MSTALSTITRKGKLSLGLVFPIESYKGSVPQMIGQEKLAQRAEELGFQALWFRDVPFHDPTFGDAGQMYDPWIYMTHIMNHTKSIVLATGSVILPLRHPVHTAKSLASLQVLSGGRVVMGIASGDRPVEYPAFNQSLSHKGELFRQSFGYLKALSGDFPTHHSSAFGQINGQVDLLPKSPHDTAFLVTGHSGQTLSWIAEHGDGWLYYPRNMQFLKQILQDWSDALEQTQQPWKPYLQSLYVDLLPDQNAHPRPIHLGFQTGASFLVGFLKELEMLGVHHVILNLKYGSRPASEVVEELGAFVLPHFEVHNEKAPTEF